MMRQTAALTLVLFLGACPSAERRKAPGTGKPGAPAPSSKDEAPVKKAATPAKKAATPAKKAEPKKKRKFVPRSYPPPTAIQPVEVGELTREPMAKVAAKAMQAHYDAEFLGLRELQFSLEFASKKTDVKAKATGWWQAGGPPVVTLTEVTRGGKLLKRPGKADPAAVGQNIAWEDLRLKMLRLIDGISNGFLSRRLHDWKSLTGTVKLDKGKLRMSFKQEFGATEVVIGKGYVVEQVSVSQKGIVRAMAYKTRLEQGRNLVSGATLTARVEDPKLSRRAHQMMKAANGTTFAFEHSKTGRYLLVTKLRKTVPGTGENLTLKISYSSAKP